MAWSLADARGNVLREGTTGLADVPRGEVVEVVLPVSRVLFARLKLPRVNAGTIRELLPFAIEDRLLADPAQIHAVPGETNARGETRVAVAAVFALSELAVPGTFFMLSFAAGAAAAAISAFVGADVAMSWIVFVGGTALALALLLPIARRFNRQDGPAGRGEGAEQASREAAPV